MVTATQNPLGVDIYESDNTTLVAGIKDVLDIETDVFVNRIGFFAFSIAAVNVRVSDLTQGRIVSLIREGDDEVFRGRIMRREWRFVDDKHILIVSGASAAIELEWLSTYEGIILDNQSASSSLSELLDDASSWTATATGTYSNNVTKRYDNQSLFTACLDLAKVLDGYIRETSTFRELELKNTHADSEIRLTNLLHVDPSLRENTLTGLVTRVNSYFEDGWHIRNRFVPSGEDEGNIPYDLGDSNRSSPYTIQSFIKNRPSIVEFLDDVVLDGAAGDELFTNEADGSLTEINVVGRNNAVVLFLHEDTDDLIGQIQCGNRTMEEIAKVEQQGGGARWLHLYIATAVTPGRVGFGVHHSDISAFGFATIYSLQDVDPRDPIRDSDSGSGDTSGTVSLTLTSGDDDLVLDCIATTEDKDGGGTLGVTVGADQTEDADFITDNAWRMNSSHEPGDASNVTMSWSLDGSPLGANGWKHIALSLKPFITYYIEDSTSVTAYDRRVSLIKERGNRPVGGTATKIQNASNTLYDRAVYEADLKDPITRLSVDVENMPSGWSVGDTLDISLIYTALDEDGAWREYLTIEDTLIIAGAKTKYSGDAIVWTLTLVNILQYAHDQQHLLSNYVRRIQALEAT